MRSSAAALCVLVVLVLVSASVATAAALAQAHCARQPPRASSTASASTHAPAPAPAAAAAAAAPRRARPALARPRGPASSLAAGELSPDNCDYAWVDVGACIGDCRGAFQVQSLSIYALPGDGGAPCPAADGTTRTVPCTDTNTHLPCLCYGADMLAEDPDPDSSGTMSEYYDVDTVAPCGACDSVSNNGQCYLACLETGASLSGDDAITCVNGTWSLPRERATCAPTPRCPDILEGAGLRYTGRGICLGATLGDVCEVYVMPGYALTGASRATCEVGGTWSEALGAVCQTGCDTSWVCTD